MRKACIMGWPVSHSRSPLIHGHWLERHGIDGAYERCPVAPEDADTFFVSFAETGYVGGNVTVPHKQTAFHNVIVEDDAARRLGAVNTIVVRDGRTYGSNTDGYGFMANLEASCPTWQPDDGPALVLGAGGAARAIVAALIDAGVEEVRLYNRSADRAASLADELGGPIAIHPWEERGEGLEDAGLLVNTTSLGMTGQPALDLSLERLPVDVAVCDIVYVPLMTALLSDAASRGNPVIDGLGMLLHQAVPGFELWFGVRPTVSDALRDLIVADLNAGAEG